MARNRREDWALTSGSLALDPAVLEREYAPAPSMLRHDVTWEPRPRAKVQRRTRTGTRVGVLLLALFAVAAAVFILYRQAAIAQDVLRLHDMRMSLRQEEKRAEDLQLQLSMKLDVSEVQLVAHEMLKMDYPDANRTETLTLAPILTGATAQMAAAGEEEAAALPMGEQATPAVEETPAVIETPPEAPVETDGGLLSAGGEITQ